MLKTALCALLLLSACTTKTEDAPSAKPSAPAEPTATATSPAAKPAAGQTMTITSKSKDAIAAFEKARDLIERARGPEALDSLEKAIELDPELALAHAYLALESGGPEAKASMDTARKLAAKASEPERLWIEANAKLLEDQPSEAIALLQKVTAAVPADWHAWLALGVLSERNHHYAEASAAFAKVRDLSPEVPMAWNGLAYTNANLQRFDEAIAAAKKQTELMPIEPNPQDTLGEILLMAGKFEEAEAAFGKALELSPNFGIAYQGIAFARAYRGDFKGAHEAVAKGMAAPDLRPIDRALGAIDDAWLTLAEGKTAEAFAAVAAVEKDPAYKDLPVALNATFQRAYMAVLVGKTKDAEKALADLVTRLESSTVASKESMQAALVAGRAYLAAKSGKPDAQALAAVEADAQRHPNDNGAQQNLIVLHGLTAAAKDVKAGLAELAKCAPENIDCHYERWLLQKKAGDKMGADLTAKQIAALPQRNPATVWILRQGLTAR